DLAVWRDRGTGRRLVHGTVLRALLPANGAEGKRSIGAVHHRHRAAARDAFVRGDGLAFGSDWAQMDHDGGMSAGGGFVPADLSRDAARGGFRGSHRFFTAAKDRADAFDAANCHRWSIATREGSLALQQLRVFYQRPGRVETDPARVYSGVLRDDGLWT